MFKFNTNNIITGEIKQKLKDFNLPSIRVHKKGMPIYENCMYLKDGGIYRGQRNNQGNLELSFIKDYVYGDNLDNLSTHLIINNNIYDSYTHRYLGDYLRFQRDYNGIDLMSMYNCYANELETSVAIQQEDTFDFNISNEESKIYAVPIRWFNLYTIGIDVATSVELVVGVYNNHKLIQCGEANQMQTLYEDTYMKVRGTRLAKPFIYDKVLTQPKVLEKCLYEQDENLTLFIKVPATSKSSLVVLEGDYTKHSELHFTSDKVFATRRIPKEVCNYDNLETERKFISRLQLLDFNSNVSYPFADRLIEYLFGSVITPKDPIAKNISRIQKRLVNRKDLDHIIGRSTTFSTSLRNVVYDIMLDSNIQTIGGANKFDINGYIDKDTEAFIGESDGRR